MIDWEASPDSPALTASERHIVATRDADAAMALGLGSFADDPVRAKAWLLFAVRHGRPDVLTRIVESVLAEPSGLRDVGPWLRKLAIRDFPRVDAPSIAVSLDLFAQISPRGVAVPTSDPTVFVQAADPHAAAEALDLAAPLVAEHHGVRVSDVTTHERGAQVTIDWDGVERITGMPAVLHRVVDALVTCGVERAYVRLATGSDWLPGADHAHPVPEEMASLADMALADESPDLAVEFGRWCFENCQRWLGDAWLRWAAARRPELAWPVAGLDVSGFWASDGWRAQDWMRRAIQTDFPRVDAPHVMVSSELFSPIVINGSAGYGVDTSVQVVSSDPAAAARVLERVSGRFSMIADTGQELTPAEMDSVFTDGSGLAVEYTPNFVSGVQFSGGADCHPWIWMDWKDGTYPLMARRMATVLAQELHAEQLVSVIRPVPGRRAG